MVRPTYPTVRRLRRRAQRGPHRPPRQRRPRIPLVEAPKQSRLVQSALSCTRTPFIVGCQAVLGKRQVSSAKFEVGGLDGLLLLLDTGNFRLENPSQSALRSPTSVFFGIAGLPGVTSLLSCALKRGVGIFRCSSEVAENESGSTVMPDGGPGPPALQMVRLLTRRGAPRPRLIVPGRRG